MEKPATDNFRTEQDIIYLKLLLCIRNKDWDVMKSLIEANPFVLGYRKGGNTILHQSLILSQVDLLSFLIDQRADIEASDSLGQTPLMKAVIFDKPKSIICLLAHEAQIDQQDHLGNSALHHALSCYNPLLIDLLIAKGANKHLKNHANVTPEQMYQRLLKQQKAHAVHIRVLNRLRTYPKRTVNVITPSFPPRLKDTLFTPNSWGLVTASVLASSLMGLALLGAPAWALMASGFTFCGLLEIFSHSYKEKRAAQREPLNEQNVDLALRPEFVAGQFFIKDALNRDGQFKSECVNFTPSNLQQPKAY